MKKEILILLLSLSLTHVFAQSWSKLESETDESLTAICFINPGTGYVCGANGTLLKTTNGGTSWDLLNSGTTLPLNDICFVNPDTGFVSGGVWDGEGIVLRTLNGGDSWSMSGSCSNQITSVEFINDSVGFYTGGAGCGTGIAMTTDAGETWVNVNNPSSHIWNREVFFVNDTIGYIVGSYEKFIKSTDGGETWTGTIDMSKGMYRGLWFTSVETGFVNGAAGVKKTVDGGKTWEIVLPGINGNNIKFASSRVGFAMNGKELYKTWDEGEHWEIEDTGSDTVLSVDFLDESYGFACGRSGALLKWSCDCPGSFQDTVTVIYYDTVHCQNYNIALSQTYSASIMDSLNHPGHNPRRAFDGDLATGWHPQSFPAEWIAVHFDKPMDIDSIGFWYGQDPAGATKQEIFSTIDSISWDLIEVIEPYHALGGGSYKYYPSDPIESSRGIKITTTENPSWVNWKEIKVWGKDPETCLFNVFDTTFITVVDSITIADTVTVTLYDTIPVIDTTHITMVDSISVTDTLIIDAVITEVGNHLLSNRIKVYPNPARDHLFIHTGNYEMMENYHLVIVDQRGTVVFEERVEQPLYEVNLSDWTGMGLYFIQVIDSGGRIQEIKKIILE